MREENRYRSLQEVDDNQKRGEKPMLFSNDPYQLRFAAPPTQNLISDSRGGKEASNQDFPRTAPSVTPESTDLFQPQAHFNQNQPTQGKLAQNMKVQEEKHLFPASDIHFNKHIKKI